jgi:tRNA A-37 threonylcarbamoyl transferase component Bud32
MGVVWAALDPDLERTVALKVLRYDDPAPELRTRLLREARAMARLKHPNVLTVYEVDSDGTRDFIAMELVDGSTLDAWLATKPPRAAVWEAILAAGRGLAAAHAAGLVHRDFKPHNVLRSHDGRVLVTDFGLARGTVDEKIALETTLPVALETTLEAKSVGSEPLTRTGVLLGTPAYMAPEQFTGATSGPRTDQFAYCVTAWQLFAGERPFRGDTLEELRRAVSAGAAGVKSNLPSAVRAVLVRGLDPDPRKRWPDMTLLLAALERAKGGRARLVRYGGIAVALGLAGALAVNVATRRDSSTAKTDGVCAATPEEEFAKAWSPAKVAAMEQRFAGSSSLAPIRADIDGFGARWIADYRSACAAPPTPKTFAKLGCLLGQRDAIANLTDMVPRVENLDLDDVELGGVLPRLEACSSETPITPPSLPDDPERRAKILDLRPRIMTMRFTKNDLAQLAIPNLLDEAKALAWDPLIAEAHQTYAIVLHRAKYRWEDAREHYATANEIARRSHHYHLEADTWLGLLRGELDAATDLRDPKAFEKLLAQARVALRNAGNDPAIAARITDLEAGYLESRGRLDEAIALYDTARKDGIAARDTASAVRVAGRQIEAILRRGRAGDLELATQLARDMERIAGEHGLSKKKQREDLFQTLWFVARMRGELEAAHRWVDVLDKAFLPTKSVELAGRVVDANGAGVAGATVVAWRGTLVGDARRAYQHPGFFGAHTITAADGSFSIRGARGTGIIAELGDRRSKPQVIGDGTLALTLEPTRELAGTITAPEQRLGLVILAHYRLAPDLAYQVLAPIGHALDYRLANLPAGDLALRLEDTLDPNQPTRKREFPIGTQPRWPHGVKLDVIVRDAIEDTNIWLFRGKVTAKSRADLTALVERSNDVASHKALVVGLGDQTEAGMSKYERGDGHAVFVATAPGDITVCVADEQPECKPFVVTTDDAIVFER